MNIFTRFSLAGYAFFLLASTIQAAPAPPGSQQKTTVAILNMTYKNFPPDLAGECRQAFKAAFQSDERLGVVASDEVQSLTNTEILEMARALNADYLLTGELTKIGTLIVMKLTFVDVAAGTEEEISVNSREGELLSVTIPDIMRNRISTMEIRELARKKNLWMWAVGGGLAIGAGVTAVVLIKGGGEKDLPDPGRIPEDLLGN